MNPKTLKELADHCYAMADLFLHLATDDVAGPVRPAGPSAATPSAAAGAPSFDELPPDEVWSEFAAAPSSPTRASVDVLAECPVHFTPWTVKEGGISKAGKPYSAFWKCNGKNADGTYCSKKPTKEWAQAHPAEQAVAA